MRDCEFAQGNNLLVVCERRLIARVIGLNQGSCQGVALGGCFTALSKSLRVIICSYVYTLYLKACRVVKQNRDLESMQSGPRI